MITHARELLRLHNEKQNKKNNPAGTRKRHARNSDDMDFEWLGEGAFPDADEDEPTPMTEDELKQLRIQELTRELADLTSGTSRSSRS